MNQGLNGVTSILVETRRNIIRGVREALDEGDDQVNLLVLVIDLLRNDVVELLYYGGQVLVVIGVGDVDRVVLRGDPGLVAVV